MGLLVELMMNIIILVIKPFSLFRLLCVFGFRSTWLVAYTWLQLVKGIINFSVDLCWRIVIWTAAIVSLPARIWNSLQRERLLETLLREMQIELDTLAWENIKLKKQLHRAIRDCRDLESVLMEIEEEHEKAIAKIELLENELQDLKEENSRLNEIQGKDLWDYIFRGDPYHGKISDDGKCNIPLLSEYDLTSWKSSFNESGVLIQDLLIHKEAWGAENKGKGQLYNFLKVGSEGNETVYSFPSKIIPTGLTMNTAIDQRQIALSRTLFSALFSLLVGMIIWEAEDACMPLVFALLCVVGMSLKSVIQFFSTINNRPASDAVALLSLNWFILGTLTYPTLPKVAHLLTPLAVELTNQTVCLLGLVSS